MDLQEILERRASLQDRLEELEKTYKNYHEDKQDLIYEINKLNDIQVDLEGELKIHERSCLEGDIGKIIIMVKIAGEHNFQIDLDRVEKTAEHQYSYVDVESELSGGNLYFKIKVHATSFHAEHLVRSMLNKELNMEKVVQWGSLG